MDGGGRRETTRESTTAGGGGRGAVGREGAKQLPTHACQLQHGVPGGVQRCSRIVRLQDDHEPLRVRRQQCDKISHKLQRGKLVHVRDLVHHKPCRAREFESEGKPWWCVHWAQHTPRTSLTTIYLHSPEQAVQSCVRKLQGLRVHVQRLRQQQRHSQRQQ